MFQEDGSSGVSELVDGHPQSRGLDDPIGDLKAQGPRILDVALLPREEPQIVRSAQQCRSIVVDVFVNERA
jgi:hypothetical protein